MKNFTKIIMTACLVAGVSVVSAQNAPVPTKTTPPIQKSDAVSQQPLQTTPQMQTKQMQTQPVPTQSGNVGVEMQRARVGQYPATEAYLKRFPNTEYSSMIKNINDGRQIDNNLRNDMMVKHRTELGERYANQEITDAEYQALIEEMGKTIEDLNTNTTIRRAE
ncbi:MAG: hypothetical protein Q4F57_04120 [Weeksellaceae bacterium]|nr:hypothetical protein [Weeksellaceae bacterium]